jgi:hypothetical protein
MSCDNTTLPERRRHWGRFSPRRMVVVALVAGLGIAVGIALHYRAHLFWRYQAIRLGLQDIQAIPNRPMPETATPNGWVRCRVGCMELSLPPELASSMIPPKNGVTASIFQHGSRSVAVALPEEMTEFSDFLNAASKLCPTSQRLTMPRLRLACYQASSDDYRWSMTPDEVRWHAFCITMRKMMRTRSGEHTETLFRKDVEGIVHFSGERAFFDWQCTDSMWGGYMHFTDRGGKIDPNWIRAVCQSVTVSPGPEMEHR